MSCARPSSLSRTNSALRSSSAIVLIRSFAALNSASSRSTFTSRSASEHSTLSSVLDYRAGASRQALQGVARLTPAARKACRPLQRGSGRKPLEAILSASRGQGRWATLGVERYPDRKHIYIRCDKHTRDFRRLQMYSRILALCILVGVLVDVATFPV